MTGKLVLACVVGAGMCLGMSKLFNKTLSDKIECSPLYQDAIAACKKHPGVLQLLGEPLEFKRPILNNSTVFYSGVSEIKVCLRGPKTRGILFVTVLGTDDTAELDTVQLQVGQDESKRLVIKEAAPRKDILKAQGS